VSALGLVLHRERDELVHWRILDKNAHELVLRTGQALSWGWRAACEWRDVGYTQLCQWGGDTDREHVTCLMCLATPDREVTG
jgi:hypothetical protein